MGIYAYYFPGLAQKNTSLIPLIHLASPKFESQCPSWLSIKTKEDFHPHLTITSCHNKMLLYHLGWAPCCFSVQSNVGHNLFRIGNKCYLIRTLGELTSRQNAIIAFGLWPKCQSRCLGLYRRIIQCCAGWGWYSAKFWRPQIPWAGCWWPMETLLMTQYTTPYDREEGKFSSWESTRGTWMFSKSLDVNPQKGWEWLLGRWLEINPSYPAVLFLDHLSEDM